MESTKNICLIVLSLGLLFSIWLNSQWSKEYKKLLNAAVCYQSSVNILLDSLSSFEDDSIYATPIGETFLKQNQTLDILSNKDYD